ncbi:YD repeat-containing protein [Dysgonomonas sp. PFB1-18]|uniref:hypothetical protein n=1 Tax=unclassified Dysgonomonas TaxID=2630389 RepID=UPI0024740636|nr:MULTISPECIES: hypothetical protein [unclassified Dysgonomonas]MDH6310760.1 YD repeat-containing protein [Dysgonomonas sp. PF1-14]MDH6340610.1 YD repeat-containing protein [Dysgonomonas sp. PF1-16]MDH6382283.1 YD repeat-containing protein [Dysgonomonas sp. PFB1-18]MDH6399580.1 YD repeat-containing protein [Dysgonomonas sp. PF1-23]
MKNLSLIALSVLMSLCLFTSCSDDDDNKIIDDDNNPTTEEKVYLPSLLTGTDDFELKLTYDDSNRLIKIIEIEDGGSDETTFTYDANDNPVSKKEVYSDGSYLTNYTYNKDTVFVVNFKKNSTTEISYMDTIIVDNKGFEVKGLNTPSGYTEVYSTYTYENNLLMKEYNYHESGTYTVEYTTVYTYESEGKGCFSGMNIKPWLFNYEFEGYYANFSNPKLVVTTYKGLDNSGSEIIEEERYRTIYGYTYNDNGYPKTFSMQEKYKGEDDDNYSYQVEYVEAK